MVRIESRLLSRCSLFIDCAEVAENKSQWLPACWIPALQCRLWEEKCDPRCCPAARLAKKSDGKLSQGCPGAVPRRHCAQPRCRPLEALLASAPWPQVRAAARSPGLLALIPLPLVRVVARSESPAALLASAPSPLVQADARTPALLCSSARRKVLRSQELPAAREQGHVSRRRKVLRRHGAQIGAADDRSPALLAFAPLVRATGARARSGGSGCVGACGGCCFFCLLIPRCIPGMESKKPQFLCRKWKLTYLPPG